jgi:hypothetical protein
MENESTSRCEEYQIVTAVTVIIVSIIYAMPKLNIAKETKLN